MSGLDTGNAAKNFLILKDMFDLIVVILAPSYTVKELNASCIELYSK